MADAAGLIFLIVFLVAPKRGLIALAQRHARQRVEFARTMLAIHLLHLTTEGREEAKAAMLR